MNRCFAGLASIAAALALAVAACGGSTDTGLFGPQPGADGGGGGPACKDGDARLADDGCNSCRCSGGSWACTEMACSGGCAAVVVWAKAPTTGVCTQYGSPCTAPAGWRQFTTAEACEAACSVGQTKPAGDGCNTCSCGANDTWACTKKACAGDAGGVCPAPRPVGGSCPAVSAWAKDPTLGTCCFYATSCTAPSNWKQFSSEQDCKNAR
jgi:hypothetical protein